VPAVVEDESHAHTVTSLLADVGMIQRRNRASFLLNRRPCGCFSRLIATMRRGRRCVHQLSVCGTPLPTIESFLCERHDDLILPHYVYETVAIKGSINHFQKRTLPYSYWKTAAIF